MNMTKDLNAARWAAVRLRERKEKAAMIIKEIPNERKDGQSSFKDLVDYAAKGDKDGKEKVEYVNYQNVVGIDTAALEMEALASENKRCSDPVYHFVLSFRELEIPTNEQVDEAVKIALEELNLDKCQAVWALHYNTENRHVHVAVNRIDPETTRAVQPANNWTYKANERAARKIELAQGWEIERSGHHYALTPDGQIVPKGKEKGAAPSLSTGARDSEAHTAAKSAERIGQEVAAPIIRAAKSWRELHEKLAAQGVSFEKKGSGAILKIGGTIIKASVAGRDISLSKLESRLGNYEPRGLEVEISSRLPEPVEKITSKIKGTWEEYQALREEYRQTKKESLETLKEKQKKEKKAMSERHKAERAEIFEGKNWSGRGGVLNQIRSVTAARQKAEQLNLRDRQRGERVAFQNLFPRTFPDFKTWIGEKDNPLSALFRYQNQPVILQETQSEIGRNNFSDLRAFTAMAGSKGGVAYTRNNHESDFLDYGKKILLSDKYDSASVLAALQLASQKWGSVNISGTDEYKQLCVKMAVKHNIRITNPELQDTIEAGKKEMAKSKSADLFKEYANAVGAERFRVVVTEFKPEGGVRAFILDKENEGKTQDEICGSMHRLESYVKYNKNINVVPLSEDKHHILIDDVTPENLEKIREDGYSPACVIESSPSNYQVILNVKSLGSDDREAANKLTKELNTRYGDPKLSGAVHAHRLPPFPNLKAKHRREDGTFPETKLVESKGGLCDKAFGELNVMGEQIRKIKEEAKKSILKDNVNLTRWNTGANDCVGAYWAHYRDIADKQKGSMDYSRVDAMIGVRMRVTGYSPSQVQAAIEGNAPSMRKENMTEAAYNEKYRNRDWHRFAKETTEKFVFGPRGTIQYSKAEDYRPYYMKLEGRSAAEEMRQFHKLEQERNITQEREGEEI